MDITKEPFNNGLTVSVKGRLDGYWSDHLSKELAEILREGTHQVRLDLSGVSYMSSAGIGTLVDFYKQFKAIQGSFAVVHASPQVRTLLSLTKLDALLIEGAPAPSPAAQKEPASRKVEHDGVPYEIFPLTPGEALACTPIGDAVLLEGCHFEEKNCQAVKLPATTFAVGLGAFGSDFTDCRSRFGEFLSVAGATAYLPTDGTSVPDYMLAAETFVPELQVLYCAKVEGAFAGLARFEANKDIGPVRLSHVVNTAFETAKAEMIGVVIIAESAGLVGVSLRRSPAAQDNRSNGSSPFGFPGVREWLSYSAERTHQRSLALIAGVAVKSDTPENAPKLLNMLRPMGSSAWPAGHFHAAAFPYRPLKKGVLDLKTTVATLFEGQSLESLMHLINDSREINGAGESEFVRGACWFGPISRIV